MMNSEKRGPLSGSSLRGGPRGGASGTVFRGMNSGSQCGASGSVQRGGPAPLLFFLIPSLFVFFVIFFIRSVIIFPSSSFIFLHFPSSLKFLSLLFLSSPNHLLKTVFLPRMSASCSRVTIFYDTRLRFITKYKILLTSGGMMMYTLDIVSHRQRA